MNATCLSLVLFALLTALSSSASAQWAEHLPAGPAPAAQSPIPAYAPRPMYFAPAFGPKLEAPAVAIERASGARFRFGFDAMLGMGLLATPGGIANPAVLGGHLRLGTQVSDLFALYYQAGAPVMLDGSATLLTQTNGVLAELTFAHLFQLGLGPTADVVYALGSNYAPLVRPGVDLHLGFAMGRRRDQRRVSFLLGFDNHVTVWSTSTMAWQSGVTLGLEVH